MPSQLRWLFPDWKIEKITRWAGQYQFCTSACCTYLQPNVIWWLQKMMRYILKSLCVCVWGGSRQEEGPTAEKEDGGKWKRTRRNNKRVCGKVESNDSPQILDRGKTLDIPAGTGGGGGGGGGGATKTKSPNREKGHKVSICVMQVMETWQQSSVFSHFKLFALFVDPCEV